MRTSTTLKKNPRHGLDHPGSKPVTNAAPETDAPDERTRVPATDVRRLILEQAKRAGVGHIGSALSIADIMEALYGRVLHVPDPSDPDRDRFILSKGHAAMALYAALFLRGWISENQLQSYCADASLLGVHPEHVLPGVDFSTGSLGQGMSIGAGAAMAARLQQSSRRVFVLLSDAECNEGAVWEAIMFAAHHGLANLVAIVDLNGQQAFGYTEDVMNLSPMAQKWRAFGWDTHEVDGHDIDAMTRVLNSLDTCHGSPHVIVARTVFGRGVSFMESAIKWHYLPVSDEQYLEALREIGGAE